MPRAIGNQYYPKDYERIRQLTAFPETGTPISSIIELEVPYRFLVCGKHTAFYRMDGDEVHIIRVLYGRRSFMQILLGSHSMHNTKGLLHLDAEGAISAR